MCHPGLVNERRSSSSSNSDVVVVDLVETNDDNEEEQQKTKLEDEKKESTQPQPCILFLDSIGCHEKAHFTSIIRRFVWIIPGIILSSFLEAK